MTVVVFHGRTFAVVEGGCWHHANRPQSAGYVQIAVAGRKTLVHRWTYAEANGPIPDGLTIDHLCRNRRCANPAHLEAVTLLENIRRAPRYTTNECHRGHLLAGDNLRKRKDNRRECRTCYIDWRRARRAQAKELAR